MLREVIIGLIGKIPLVESSKMCKQNGANEVYCVVTHGCFTPIGEDRLIKAFREKVINHLFYSNTVTGPKWEPDGIYSPGSPTYDRTITVIDIAPVFAKAILNIHNNESVSELFK